MSVDASQIVNRCLAFTRIQLQSAEFSNDPFAKKAYLYAAGLHLSEAMSHYCVELGIIEYLQLEKIGSLHSLIQHIRKIPLTSWDFRAQYIADMISESGSWLNTLNNIQNHLKQPPKATPNRTDLENSDSNEDEYDQPLLIATTSAESSDDRDYSLAKIEAQTEWVLRSFEEVIYQQREYSAEY